MEWPESADEGLDASRQTAGALRSWLVRGTQKGAVHPRRRTGRHQGARELLADDAGWLPGDRSGWRGLVTALQRHSVLHALAQLRKGERDILTMAYLEGHTNQEIGRMLQVSARTVSRRLAAALSQLEEHARNAGIWIAAFGLVVLAAAQRRLGVITRTDGWQTAALGTAAVVTVATITFVGLPAASQQVSRSAFSPVAHSVNAGPLVQVPASAVELPAATVVAPPVELTAAHKSKPAHDPAGQTAQLSATHGCGGNPTSAAPPAPVRSHGAGSPVTHPGPGGCGPHAGKTVLSGH
jgi:sigma-70-like protein